MLKKISSDKLRDMYQEFFESKGHASIPSAPLVPENDPSVLFTTAGMHPLVSYLKGQSHPAGRRLVNVQKCLRTTDIDAVGDETHATVFEMLGNWSLGDYFKQAAIEYSWEFLTSSNWLGINPEYLAVSVFGGDNDAPRDEVSAEIWQEVGVAPKRIAFLDKTENWWPAYAKSPDRQSPPMGPQGPDTEMFYWVGREKPPAVIDPEDERWVEIWNDVFMQYDRSADGKLGVLKQKNVDTGMGLERTVMALNGLKSIYEIDSFARLMQLIDRNRQATDEKQRRILADHIKAVTFVLGDESEVKPSNSEQGYVARRLIRRAAVAARMLGIKNVEETLLRGQTLMTEEYEKVYASLRSRADSAAQSLQTELAKFEVALDRGLKELTKQQTGNYTGFEVFRVSSTYAVPIALAKEFILGQGGTVSPDFDQELAEAQREHQEKSRTAAAGKFKGGLADTSEKSIKYHTATHLLHQALRDVLGEHAVQKGSNITPTRLRFDFSYPDKLTAEQKRQVEEIVNDKIAQGLPVARQEMSVAEAKARGALGLFEDKYGDKVNLYSIGNYSVEICGGPHVKTTSELGNFKITSEKSIGFGLRRIKAVLT